MSMLLIKSIISFFLIPQQLQIIRTSSLFRPFPCFQGNCSIFILRETAPSLKSKQHFHCLDLSHLVFILRPLDTFFPTHVTTFLQLELFFPLFKRCMHSPERKQPLVGQGNATIAFPPFLQLIRVLSTHTCLA